MIEPANAKNAGIRFDSPRQSHGRRYLGTFDEFHQLSSESHRISEEDRRLQSARERFENLLAAWLEERAYIDYDGAMWLARTAGQQGDYEVALLFKDQAQAFLEDKIISALDRMERFEKMLRAKMPETGRSASNPD